MFSGQIPIGRKAADEASAKNAPFRRIHARQSEAPRRRCSKQALEQESFGNYSGKVHFLYGKTCRILAGSDRALEMLGVKIPEPDDDREAVYRTVEYASMQSLESIAAMCEREMAFENGSCHAALQDVFLRRVDGTYLEISCWVSCKMTGSQKECVLEFVEDSRHIKPNEELTDDPFVNYMAQAFDVVLTINYEKKIAIFNGVRLGYGLRAPVGVPMRVPDAFTFWVNSTVAECDREKAIAFLDLENRPQFGKTRQTTLSIFCNGRPVPFNAMIIGCNCGSVLLFKRATQAQNDENPNNIALQHPGAFIRTFGHFDIFIDGQSIPFASEKAKEYLALLVDRRGGCVSSREAAVCLFDSTSASAFAKCRKAAMYMNKALREHGIEDIIESVGSSRRLVLGKVRCDLFDFLSASEEERGQMFNGSYLLDYNWGEETKAELVFS